MYVVLSTAAVIIAALAAYVVVNFRDFQQTEYTRTYHKTEVSDEAAGGGQIIPRKTVIKWSKQYKNC